MKEVRGIVNDVDLVDGEASEFLLRECRYRQPNTRRHAHKFNCIQ